MDTSAISSQKKTIKLSTITISNSGPTDPLPYVYRILTMGSIGVS